MRKTIFLICAFCASLFAIGDLTPVQRSFLRDRVRVVAQDTKTKPGYVISTMRKGSRVWVETNKLAVINYRRAPRKYSKIRIIGNLKEIDKWADVKQFIQSADLWDEWVACQYIQDDYPAFIAATNSAVLMGLGTDQQIKDILKNSEDK